jgi:hypothetical protein
MLWVDVDSHVNDWRVFSDLRSMRPAVSDSSHHIFSENGKPKFPKMLCSRQPIGARGASLSLTVVSDISEIHSDLIRAVTRAVLAYFVDIGGMATAIGMIRVETVIRDR